MEDPKTLFNNNTKLVYKVFNEKLYSKNNVENRKEDILQVGFLTLWKCCINYNPEKGTQFSTYAYNAIYKSMVCSLVRENRKTAYLVSLNDKIKAEKDCDLTYEDIIASAVNIESEVEINDILKQISTQLGKNSEKIIDMIKRGHTQVDIAKELNVTRAYVGKLLKQIREKVKNTLFFEE